MSAELAEIVPIRARQAKSPSGMRKPGELYVLARTGAKRATLMHRISHEAVDFTACGRWIGEWSRAYLAQPISQVYCIACSRSHR